MFTPVTTILFTLMVTLNLPFLVSAQGSCPNDKTTTIMESLLKLIKEISGGCRGQHTPIAFYAALTKHTTLSGSQTIAYDKVYTNHGNAYDPKSGNFKAPVKGLYFFSATQLAYKGSLHLTLMKNNNQLGIGYGDEHIDTASLSGTVELNKEDVVSVQHHGVGTQKVHGGDYSTFTGYLITTL